MEIVDAGMLSEALPFVEETPRGTGGNRSPKARRPGKCTGLPGLGGGASAAARLNSEKQRMPPLIGWFECTVCPTLAVILRSRTAAALRAGHDSGIELPVIG